MTLIDKAEALAPCPFCTEGKTVSTYFDHEQGDKWGYASCDACGARGPEVRTNYDRADNAPWRAEAIAAWNRRAIPARGVGADAVLDAAHAYLVQQYGHSALAHPIDRARILAALEPAPTDAAQVREAALREAAEACRYDDAHDCRAAIIALIGEART